MPRKQDASDDGDVHGKDTSACGSNSHCVCAGGKGRFVDPENLCANPGKNKNGWVYHSSAQHPLSVHGGPDVYLCDGCIRLRLEENGANAEEAARRLSELKAKDTRFDLMLFDYRMWPCPFNCNLCSTGGASVQALAAQVSSLPCVLGSDLSVY